VEEEKEEEKVEAKEEKVIKTTARKPIIKLGEGA